MWDIFNNYLNPVVNEMYTAMKINAGGRIVPTLTIREKPFSTGLFNALKENTIGSGATAGDVEVKPPPSSAMTDLLKQFEQEKSGDQKNQSLTTDKKLTPNEKFIKSFNKTSLVRTMYGNLPRWVISETVVKSFTFSSSESARINFVQVYGRNAGAVFMGSKINQAEFMNQQFASGNFYVDQKDISRNGLRAYIQTSQYDIAFGSSNGSLAKVWAKMNADWLFNGHLKANGTLVVTGIEEPICEGDNLEYRGILFHIESVSHAGQLASGGRKIWTTTIQLSNGLLANSVKSAGSVPSYPAYMGRSKKQKGVVKRQQFGWPFLPGINEAQQRRGDTSKNKLGDAKNKTVGKATKLT